MRVALLPVHTLGVDAAILFSDIMIPLIKMGVPVRIVDAVGPVIDPPISSLRDVGRLHTIDPAADLEYLRRTIALLKDALAGRVPVIGFAGAPFTLASYLIEGKPSRDFLKTKRVMFRAPAVWERLMDTLTEAITVYLCEQIRSGVDAVQLFDSWAGCLAPSDYERFVLPYTVRIFKAAQRVGRVPRIHFGTNVGAFLRVFASPPCEVVGVDWRIALPRARQEIGKRALQGNLDPAVLLADWGSVRKKVDSLLRDAEGHEGYIFNLGHGVLPATPVKTLQQLVAHVHAA